jgi:hypothetical protein
MTTLTLIDCERDQRVLALRHADTHDAVATVMEAQAAALGHADPVGRAWSGWAQRLRERAEQLRST